MQFLVAGLIGGFLQVAGSMVGRVLLALGISFVVYSGIDLAMTYLVDNIKSNMSAMPVDILNFLAWLWVDKALSLMFSAYTAAAALKMAGGTTLTKMVTK